MRSLEQLDALGTRQGQAEARTVGHRQGTVHEPVLVDPALDSDQIFAR